MLRLFRVGLFIAVLILASCKPEEVLPTEVSLDAFATEMAATQTFGLPTPTATRSIPTLPPTFTPTMEATATPSETLPPSTETPPGFSANGFIYYLYNGDSIAYMQGDGQNNSILVTFGVGRPISFLTLSPDQSRLAFVGPGPNETRELFVTNHDGTSTLQVSCLGFFDIRQPTWSPDSKTLVFYGSAQPGGPLDIYAVSLAAGTSCPTGNNQRLLVPTNNPQARDLTWSADGRFLFYSVGPVFVMEFPSGVPRPITLPSGFGPDFGMAHSPTSNKLYFLRTVGDVDSNIAGGGLAQIDDTSQLPTEAISPYAGAYLANRLKWSRDGSSMLIITSNGIQVLDEEKGSVAFLVSNLPFTPYADFSPDVSRVAYTSNGADGNIQQIFTITLVDRIVTQLTFNPEGSVSDVVWAGGAP